MSKPFSVSGRLLGWLAAAVWLATPLPSPAGAPVLRVAAFRCDITPPVGEPLIWATPLVKVEDPLLAKGLVLESGTNRFVLCALDWCLLGGESEVSFRQALAAAAAASPDCVAVQCLHQHAAPCADEGAHRLLDQAPKPLPHLSSAFLDQVRLRLGLSVAEAVGRLQPFNQVGTGQARVERVASARRLRGEDGRIVVRYSGGAKNPKLAEAPEGDIDPALKTVTFARDGVPLTRLHYYATHPQTFCCDGRASSDFVGRAREALEEDEKVPQIYFTGCAGDVTVGKYNDQSPQAMKGLGERLGAGLRAAIASTRLGPATNLLWRAGSAIFPPRGPLDVVMAQSRVWLEDAAQPDAQRVYKGAMRLAFLRRFDHPVRMSALRLGSVCILHLPGEPMLEFQRFAQQARRDCFVVVAGYGDCGPAYICTEAALGEGGYEPSATNLGTGAEAALKEAIRNLVSGDGEGR